jgi:hypothetical protein
MCDKQGCCSKERFRYLGVRSISALSKLDLTEGDNAKIDLTPSRLSCFEQPGPECYI